MKRILLALVAGVLAAGASTSAAAADTPPPSAPPSIQTAGQVATSAQLAGSSATSTQVAPQNTNVSVNVLSPGSSGPVSQTNGSSAAALAGNANGTTQSIGQAGGALQQAGQLAASAQGAKASAESTQVKPENTNVNVRVLSPGNNGSVTQANESSATAIAANLNKTDQAVSQGGDGALTQSAEQAAFSKQGAVADADSKQIAPKNTNVSVRVLSPGDDGAVTQRNESAAKAVALNGNFTDQDITQAGGHDGTSAQSAGQVAGNLQGAVASADSTQIKPENTNVAVRVLSPGHGGDVTQSNSSHAGAFAVNLNHTDQDITQELGGRKELDDRCCQKDDGVVVQAAGQIAANKQSAGAWADSLQVKPSNVSAGSGDGSVTQLNDSAALAKSANLNGLSQTVDQSRDGGYDEAGEPKRADEPESAPDNALREAPSVEQANLSNAASLALNLNKTEQSIDQQQYGRGSGVAVQAAGQVASNEQGAYADAESVQYGPSNLNGIVLPPRDKRCKDDRCKPDPCKYERCKPDPKRDPCRQHEYKRDPCDKQDWPGRKCKPCCGKHIPAPAEERGYAPEEEAPLTD